jgi:hypothetical protein
MKLGTSQFKDEMGRQNLRMKVAHQNSRKTMESSTFNNKSGHHTLRMKMGSSKFKDESAVIKIQ